MPYLYETHLHTSQASACGVSRGHEYISKYKDLGYTGVIITDHFFGGNSAVSRSLPWKRRIELFCKGWEDAREEGARKGLDVFFGWEQTYDGDDYLIYGLDKAWLMEHPESASWSRKQQFEKVSRAGGCVVQAHPFRQHFYIRRVTLASALVHGVEAANGGNQEQSYDALAWAYAKKLGLPVTAGSDIHSADDVRKEIVFGVWLDKKMETIADYVAAVKGNHISSLKFCPGRCDLAGNEDTIIPVEILDAQENIIGRDIRKFLNL
jgi:hypothetical protein